MALTATSLIENCIALSIFGASEAGPRTLEKEPNLRTLATDVSDAIETRFRPGTPC